jgi:SAM-dependent methyltransferase
MKERFEEIYRKNEWGYGSGPGSLPKHNKGYIEFVENFIKDNNIKSVVDMGCGDWQFSRMIDWNGAQYKGFDIVKSVIAENKEHYSSDGVDYYLYSGKPSELPEADLLLAKDVLQHLSNKMIYSFISILDKYNFSLITNCVGFDGIVNECIEDGGFSHLDLRLPPFNVELEEMFKYTNKKPLFFPSFLFKPSWQKKVLLHRVT